MKKCCLLLFSMFAVLYSIAGNRFCYNDNNYNLSSLSPNVAPSVSIAASSETICASGSMPAITFTATPTNGGSSPYYYWFRNSDTVFQGTNSYIYVCNNYHDGDVFTCKMISNLSGAFPSDATSNSVTITVNNSKDTTATACGTSYYFRNSFGPYTSSGTYAIPVSNGAGCDSVINLYLTLSKPNKPTIVHAGTEVCSAVGSTASFSLSSPDASYYHNWVAPFGTSYGGPSPINWSATVVSGQGTATAGLSFTSNLANKLLYLQVYDSSVTTGCVSDPDTLLLTMTVPALDTILPISGVSSLCTSQLTGQSFTANPGLNGSAITGYTWTVTNGTLISGQGTSSAVVDFTSGFVAYSVKVAASSACGTRAARTLNISKQGAPSLPTLILSSFNPNVPAVTSICGSSSYTYRIRSNASATSYTWSLKNGTNASISHLSSGVTDTAVTVSFDAGFTSDSLMVTVSNSCGTSLPRKILLRVNTSLPPSVATLSGEVSPCNGSTYNYTATTNTPTASQTTLGSIRWYLPANATITSANADSSSVYINYSSSFTGGTITIRSQSACGILNSSFKSLALKRGTPGIRVISGQTSPCPNNSYTYSDTAINLSSTQSPIVYYRWVRPTGTSITSANSDSSAVVIRFGSTYTGGVIQSYGVNACGLAGSAKVLQLKYLPPTPSSISSRSGSFNACINDTISYTAIVPAPSTSQQSAVRYRWAKPSTTTILSANADSSQITLKFNTGYTGGTLSVRGVNACGGLGSLKSQVLTHTGCPTGTKLATTFTNIEMPMDVVVYPNPSNAGFNMIVNSSDKSNITVIVRDIQGKSIDKILIKPYETKQIGNTLAPGTYMIETRQGTKTTTTKVVRY